MFPNCELDNNSDLLCRTIQSCGDEKEAFEPYGFRRVV